MKIFRIVVLAVFVQIVNSQQPAPGLIRGTVIQAGTNTPLANATVELRAPAATGPAFDSITTDSSGVFLFPAVPAGQYRLVATRPGYAKAEYGQRKNNDPALTLTIAAGQRAENLTIPMSQGGTISGRITDNGKPIGIADVMVAKMVDNDGFVAGNVVLATKTNDLGDFRLIWVPPGQYNILVEVHDDASTALPLVVSPDGNNSSSVFQTRLTRRAVFNRSIGAGAADNEMHAVVFYPGTLFSEKAVTVEVRPGSELSGIDINAPAIPAQHVRGTVLGAVNAAGQPVRANLALIPDNKNITFISPPQLQAELNGSFDFPRIPAGQYTLIAGMGSLVTGTRRASVPIEVRDRDPEPVTIKLESGGGFELTGRIVIEGQTSTPPDAFMPLLRVTLRQNPNNAAAAGYGGSPTAANGTFKIPPSPAPGSLTPSGIPAGDYRVLVSPILVSRSDPTLVVPPLPAALRNTYVKSIRLGDRDVLNDGILVQGPIRDPLEIIVGANPGSIEGRVINSRQQPLSAVWVALIPENKLKFRVDHKFTSTDALGRFQLDAVPPGDYKIYAWEDVEKLTWQEPPLMRAFESMGTPVHIDEGKKATLELSAIPARN